jgi:serine-type D-Ala-D-Ala carboxypeptidase (penicillin-binding protein 5/6)
MTAFRHAVRALALSLSLTAAGASCIGTASPVAAAANDPIGGRQLAGRGVIVNLKLGVPAPPAMPGASFLIADLDTGQILAARAPHAPRLPASTLKTLTALTLIPLLDPTSNIMVKPEDVRTEGSSLGITAGTAYSVATLMQGLLMTSGNDSALALARGNHSVAATVKAMNATAAGLNAFDTVAKNPSGLDKAGQTSSAYDLALIGRAAMKLPDFRRYVSTKEARMPGGRSADGRLKPAHKIGSHNRLLYNYPGAIGIKTGFTNAAKNTYVGAATRGGKTYILTQMGSPTSSWRPSAALLDWAFAHGSKVTPIGRLVEPGTAPKPAPSAVAGEQAEAQVIGAPPAPVREPTGSSGLPPWIGMAGLIGVMALVGGWTMRNISRTRR